MEIQDVAYMYKDLNGLSNNRMRNWCFSLGMGFADLEKWWVAGDEQRVAAHEGLDFFWYAGDGGTAHVQAGELVPCCDAGQVMARCADFLGQSLFVVSDQGSCLIYSHITTALATGDIVEAGMNLGVISPSHGVVPPHLHISKLWPAGDWDWSVVTWPWLQRHQVRFCLPFRGEMIMKE